jgi:photosystem I subunit 11
MTKNLSKPAKSPIYLVGDSPTGELATPINASDLSTRFINSLPAYRKGLTPFRRGLEVGMAHGYWLLGPFAALGPLRDAPNGNLVGLISTLGLVLIATLAIALYAASNPPQPKPIVTVPEIPNAFTSTKGWDTFAVGFLAGGVGGAIFAFFLLSITGIFTGF